MQWNEFRSHVRYLPASELEEIEKAFKIGKRVHAGQKRYSGDHYFTHPIAVAHTLADMEADRDTIIAALLHDAIEDTALTLKEVEDTFNENVASLIDGVTKLKPKDFLDSPNLDEKIESLRKMFTMLEKDVRIIVIKIADRLHNMQTIEFMPPKKQIAFAQETMAVYVKIADRLCMQDIRDELEILCLAVLDPDAQNKLMQLRKEQEKEGLILANSIKTELKKDPGLKQVEVFYESKQCDALLKELELKGSVAKGIATLILVFVCRETTNIYQVLGFLHQKWQQEELSFEDFINSPRINGYRGVHTTIILPDGTRIRCKIRTEEMHRYARNGISTLCFDSAAIGLPDYLLWTKRIKTLSEDTKQKSEEFWDSLQNDILGKSIAIFSAGERRVEVPEGSTALDGAFYAFGEQALYTRQIQINGREVGLQTILNRADALSISLAEKKMVKREWLDIVNTGLATATIRSSLSSQPQFRKLQNGLKLLQTEFDRYRIGEVFTALEKNKNLLNKLNAENIEDLLIRVGEGTITPSEVVEKLPNAPALPGFLRHFINRLFKEQDTRESTLHLHAQGRHSGKENIHEILRRLSLKHKTRFKHLHINQNNQGYFWASFSVISDNKQNLDRFFNSLQEQETVSSVKASLFGRLRLQLAVLFFMAFACWSFFLIALHRLATVSFNSFLFYLIIVPVLLCNIYIYRFAVRYFSFVRHSTWFLFLIFFLNTAAITLFFYILNANKLDILHLSVFFPITILILSAGSIIFVFSKGQHAVSLNPSVTIQTGKNYRREKLLGYLIRLGAVVIWGLEPIFIKYTPANTVDPAIRVFLKAAGGMLPSVFLGLIVFGLIKKKLPEFKIPYSYLFIVIIAAEMLFAYLHNSSLIYTSSTNVILLNNFAPVIALIIAVLLWRQQIPYLRKNSHLFMIFTAFFIGGLGSTLLFYNDIKFSSPENLMGDVFGTLTMLADVVLVLAIIRFIGRMKENRSIALNLNIFFFVMIASAPFALLSQQSVWQLTGNQLLFCVGAGVLSGFGRILNFEAFYRIDGLLAFLMFNISIFITFVYEAFFLDKIPPTWLLITGGLMIVGASSFAEFINSKCEKEENVLITS